MTISNPPISHIEFSRSKYYYYLNYDISSLLPHFIHEQISPIQNQFAVTKDRNRYSDPIRHQEDATKVKYQYDNMNYHQDQYDLNRDIGRRYLEPLKTHDTTDDTASKMSTARITVSGDGTSMHSWNTTKIVPKGNYNRQQKSSPPKFASELANQWQELDNGNVLKIERPHFRLPNKPSLLKKLSDASYTTATATDEQQLHSPSTTHSTDELRSQLPWSYFHGRDDVLPRKTFSHSSHTNVAHDDHDHDSDGGGDQRHHQKRISQHSNNHHEQR